MAITAEKHSSLLERIKKNVRQSWEYSYKNHDRFHKFRKYLFETALDENQQTILADQGKPIIEFNILMPAVSRLLGEFCAHEPSIEVRPANGIPIPAQICTLVENHIRHINYEADKNSCSYEVYKDLLSGGFSVLKVIIDWESPMSFLKVIKKQKTFDPTLCGFDPMARHSHKGDGSFCFELYPKTHDDFKTAHPEVDISKVSYLRSVESFNWSYQNQNQVPILLMGEYYEKKIKKAKIVELSNGKVMTEKNYQKFEAWWKDLELAGDIIEQMPQVVGKPRTTELEKIIRYKLIETEIFEEEETDYAYLPLVYVQGNSAILQQGENNSTYEFSTPYIYHAKGTQDLMNFAGQSLGQYLDNIIQHKFIIKKEAIPQEEEYQEPLKDVQHARTVVVNAYNDNNPEQQIPEPIREIQNIPAPPEVMGTFTACPQLIQSSLATFDASLDMRDNRIVSGEAVIESATQNNAAAFPYLKGYLQAETQCANIIADLIPKYLLKKQSLPVVDKKGKRDYVQINGKNDDGSLQPKFDYEEKALTVEISAGVNYAIAKNKALTQIFALMQASPTAAEFFSTRGFTAIVDNMEFHGADVVKEEIEKWLEEKKKMPPQPNPEQMKMQAEMAKIQQRSQESYQKQQMHQSQQQISIMELQKDYAKLMSDLKLSYDQNYRENKRASTDHASTTHDMHLKQKDQEHKHAREREESHRENIRLHHEINQPKESHHKSE